MARWHFDLCFVPDEAAVTAVAAMQSEALELLVQGLGSSLSVAGWRVFGGELGHRVEVRLWGSGEVEIIAKLDTRARDSDRFVRDVCLCAQTLHCRIFSVELGEYFEPDPELIKEALRRSAAWRLAISCGPTFH